MSELTAFSEALTKLVAAVSSSVVSVKAGAYRTVNGIIVDSEYMAVPEHALKRRDSIPFITHSGEDAIAKVLGRDPGIDLAILRVEGLKPIRLPVAEAESLRTGMLAVAIGMTRDVGPSVSLGILGAVGPERRTWKLGTLDQFIRLDINLYPSQNGAAVFDAEGRLIGMATPALSRHSTITVPVSTIRRTIKELQAEGRIRRGYIGVGVQPVKIPDHLREKISGSPEAGLIVLSVVPGAAAEQAGLQVGDILLQLKGQSLEDVEQLQTQLRGELIGKPSELLILRGGDPRTLSVTIQEQSRE